MFGIIDAEKDFSMKKKKDATCASIGKQLLNRILGVNKIKMNKNNKALSTIAWALIIIVILVVIVAVAIASSQPAAVQNDVTVYLDTVKQNVNITQPQTLNWGNIAAGNVYTKNLTVTNTGSQNLTLMLLTTEPLGTSQTWAYNNTILPPLSYASGSLTLTLSITPSSGQYTWRLLATNNTMIIDPTVTPTPTSTSTSTPTPNYMLTLDLSDIGLTRVNVTIGTNKITLTPSDDLQTFSFKSGSTITVETAVSDGYAFNTYLIDDGTFNSNNPATWTNQKTDITITPTTITP
jgi:hypothetical protein